MAPMMSKSNKPFHHDSYSSLPYLSLQSADLPGGQAQPTARWDLSVPISQVTRVHFANLAARQDCNMLDFWKKIQGTQHCIERSTQHCPQVAEAAVQGCHRVWVSLDSVTETLR